MEEAVISLLLDDAGVAALVSTRVYPGSRVQGSALPAVVINRVSGAPVYTDDGESGLSQARLQVDCWGTTYSSAKGVARAVKAVLSAYNGAVDDAVFQNVLLDAERDLREGGGNASEYPFRTGLDFIFWYEE